MKSARWLKMTRIEQYHERERVIRMLHEISLDFAWKRPDVTESCYRKVVELREQNERLLQVIANIEAGVDRAS